MEEINSCAYFHCCLFFFLFESLVINLATWKFTKEYISLLKLFQTLFLLSFECYIYSIVWSSSCIEVVIAGVKKKPLSLSLSVQK